MEEMPNEREQTANAKLESGIESESGFRKIIR